MWQDALRTTWLAHMGQPVEWGVLDCCQFVREYARNLTGVDYGANLVYSTEDEANALIASHGDLLGLLTSILGQPKDEAEAGDVVVTDMGGAYGAAVWQGNYAVGVHPTEGLVRYRAKIKGAWCLK